MNVRAIVTAYLKTNGFDGLACDGCGCGIDDLMPCDFEERAVECEPAHRNECDGTCSGCDSTGENDRAGNCFRVAKETPNAK